MHWHRLEPHCPECGRSTTVINGGMARHCARCGLDHFPRTDPAVIVAVVDAEDRLLLGGKPEWGNRVSVLAGFVETGESLEQAKAAVRTTAEGVQSCRSVLELARRVGVDVPITEGVVRVCHEGLPATELVPSLMGRDMKDERPVTA